MVAIVSGNSLGLDLTSKGTLGNKGVLGDSTLGPGNEKVYVNAATGNLILQQQQDELVGPDLNIDSVLTYNSLGQATDDNGDNFSLGKFSSQIKLTFGTVNMAGSTVMVTGFDGSQAIYTWDAANSRYTTASGGGAYDTLSYAGSTYALTDGATQQVSAYDGATGRLLSRAAPTGQTLTYGYDATSGQLTSVSSSDGEVVRYVYSGNLLQQIIAPITMGDGISGFSTSQASMQSYTYDRTGRLTGVSIILTTDSGNAYQSTYTYDGTSKRVQSVTESDGTKLTFAYDTSLRIKTVTDGLGNVTTYTYDTTNRKTSVLANGQTTVYAYDTTGQLLSVTMPAVSGVTATTSYAYDAKGNVSTVTDADGRKYTFTYDANGNQLSQSDSLGALTLRTFDAKNYLLTQTTSTLLTPTLVTSGALTVSGGTVIKTGTTVGWNAAVRSLTSIAGASTVSFTAAATIGDLAVGLNSDPDTDASFTSIDYALRLTNGSLFAYANGTQVSALGTFAIGDRLSVSYDGAGHVQYWKNGVSLYALAATPAQPLYVDSSFYTTNISVAQLGFGAGNAPSQTTRYVYRDDNKGVLRFMISPAGRVTEYNYDGGANDGLVNHVNEFVGATYNVSSLASNAVPTYATMVTWHGAQDLTSTERTDMGRDVRGQLTGVTSYAQTAADGSGINNNATTVPTYYMYDAAGNMVWKNLAPTSRIQRFDSLGRLTYVKDEQGVVTRYTSAAESHQASIAYANGLTRYSSIDANGNTTAIYDSASTSFPLNGVSNFHYDANNRLGSSNNPDGYESWALYDAANRKVADIDGDGHMTEYVYDNANLVTETISYNTPLSYTTMQTLGDVNGPPLNPDISTVRPAASAGLDQRSWHVYDAAGHLVQTIGALGAVTQFTYDGAGQLTATTQFATLIDTSTLGGTPAAVNVASTAADRTTRNYYDVDGNLTGTRDPLGYLTEYQYDGAGQRTVTTTYVNKSTSLGALTLAEAHPAASVSDQRAVTLYDMEGHATGQVDPQGILTQTFYNSAGQVEHTVRYATAVGAAIAAGTAVASIAPASLPSDRVTRNTYTALGQLATQTDPDGFLTAYTYDSTTGQLTSTTSNYSGYSAVVQRRYDIYGRVYEELGGEGTASIPVGATQAQIDAIWAARATKYAYDSEGNVISRTDPLGHISYGYYDGHGRVIYTVDAQGGTTHNVYDSFGNLQSALSTRRRSTPPDWAPAACSSAT